MTIIILLIIIGTLLLVLLLGKVIMRLKFQKQVAVLYVNTKNVSDQIYHSNLLKGLPEPVLRYFKLVLKDGQPYISVIRLEHNGQFKSDLKKGYINITGEQYFSVDKPQFIWKGETTMFTAIDSYLADQGSLKVLLLNILIVVNSKGRTLNEGELQRWMAESVWFPTNLLPSEKVKWIAIDENSAKISFHYKETSFEFMVTFNAIGEITTMQTERFMTNEKRETWFCKMSNYKEVDGMQIPFSAEVVWRLSAGDFSYAKFEVQKIEYNKYDSEN
ncbi:hypothetical protein K0U91_00770 [Chryseobacterium chendengshani]|uniref:DUF6544 family protein n=1 Tax=Chryseobacterium sp. LJ668 TaxID=2864040 RepID=UPI001C689A4B|nr:DUF6544 family protein [Chryseobacterium sp. LJ668]MBW8523756.1 hypothetical protein [Chryseobacterium sp. LJ668]QYK16700.1 hypothetical protein K0U91_00770 [Chryseobacterium sp. LJ668]